MNSYKLKKREYKQYAFNDVIFGATCASYTPTTQKYFFIELLQVKEKIFR